jgi:D-cysteine desulfhydrase
MDYLLTASGSGGTHAGITASMYALRSHTKVVGISTRHPEDVQTAHIHALADKTLKFATGDEGLDLPKDTVVVKDSYVGPGYSLPTEAMEEAVTLFARLEGILLDPVYTGKAAAGLIDLVRSGFFPEGSNVLFLHTGGAPSLYHYRPIDVSVEGVAGAGTKKVLVDDGVEDEKKAD